MKFALVLLFCIVCAFAQELKLTADQKRRSEQFTSIFENDTIKLQYGYCENIKDGRGFTAGRAGFTTGTGDAYDVVKKYTEKKAGNPLAKYLNTMKKLKDGHSDKTNELNGYCDAWKKAAKDAAFRKVQDEVSDTLYFHPAMKLAGGIGIKSGLGGCAFYDTIIQHGEGDDEDSINAIIKRTKKKAGAKVTSTAAEKTWLQEFLKVRREDLVNPADKSTQKEWSQSVDRVDALAKLLKEGNMDLKGPIHIKTPNHEATIP